MIALTRRLELKRLKRSEVNPEKKREWNDRQGALKTILVTTPSILRSAQLPTSMTTPETVGASTRMGQSVNRPRWLVCLLEGHCPRVTRQEREMRPLSPEYEQELPTMPQYRQYFPS